MRWVWSRLWSSQVEKSDPGGLFAAAVCRPRKTFSVTVRATNGATWETDFKHNEKVSKVIKESLDHFVAEGAMSQGDYRLVLIVNDQAQPPLPEDAKLEDTAVRDGALLALTPRDPQVDG